MDVRDLAAAHIQSLLIEKAGGNRFAVTKRKKSLSDIETSIQLCPTQLTRNCKYPPENFTWQDTLDILNQKGHIDDWPKATRGKPGDDCVHSSCTSSTQYQTMSFLNLFHYYVGSGKSIKQNRYDNSKSIEYLELEYHPFESTILDMSSSLAELSKKW